MRLKTIDLFKGLLIILVILGHILKGKMDEAVWRTIIYSFHMPLFIGISGFLFNVDKIITLNLIELFKKYLLRVIVPWTIVIIFFFSVSVFQQHNSNILSGFIKAFIFPFYHLWFIPGFLSWVFLSWFFKKNKVGDKQLLIIGLFISLVFIILKKYPSMYQDLEIINSVINFILHTFRPYFYFFFVFGIVYSRINLKKPNLFEYVIPLLCFINVIWLFYNPNKVLSIINFFIFNSFLISITLKVSVHNLIEGNKTIERIGLNSLAIYLWHVFPILICEFVIGSNNLTLFYSVSICIEIVFIITYYYLLRFNFLRKYVFGM